MEIEQTGSQKLSVIMNSFQWNSPQSVIPSLSYDTLIFNDKQISINCYNMNSTNLAKNLERIDNLYLNVKNICSLFSA